MIIRSNIFKKVTIVGVGLMGGSLGLALKKHKLAREVIGLSYQQSSLVQALKIKAIDVGLTDTSKAIRGADLVVLATPVNTIIKLLTTIKPYLRRGCIVTDVGSIKGKIVEEAEKILLFPGFFVGSHPLAGSEKKGAMFADPDLFEGARCIMTPTAVTNQVAKEKVKYLWSKIGAKVNFMSTEEHDTALAHISHLPHLLAYGLMRSIPDQYLEYGSQGLKDTTRIASSTPQMWNDIFMANSKKVIKALDDLVRELGLFRKTIIDRDQDAFIKYFTLAKEKRDGMENTQE